MLPGMVTPRCAAPQLAHAVVTTTIWLASTALAKRSCSCSKVNPVPTVSVAVRALADSGDQAIAASRTAKAADRTGLLLRVMRHPPRFSPAGTHSAPGELWESPARERHAIADGHQPFATRRPAP